jgi:hypothetical protein
MTKNEPTAAHLVGEVTGEYFYSAYGLLISSSFAIDELDAAERGVPDIVVRLSSVPRRGPVKESGLYVEFSPSDTYFEWPGFSRFLLKSTFEIDVELENENQRRLLALALLGAVMAVALFRKGYLVLHGSCVAVDGNGVIFLGDKGAGKSTTAAAMLAAGYDLVSDDVVAIDVTANPPRIMTAYPSVKLTASASAQFAPAGATILPPPEPDFPKNRFRLASMTRTPSTPAAVAYVLARGDSAGVQELDPQTALSAIMRFSYLVRFGEKLLNGADAGIHFRQCAMLSQKIPVALLTAPNSLESLQTVPPLIAATLQAVA